MGFLKYYRNAKHNEYYIKHCKGQSHAFRKHSHQEYSVALVTDGESSFRFIDDEFHIKKGQLIVISPDVAHQCNPRFTEQWGFYMLHVSSSWVKEAGFDIEGQPAFAISDLSEEEYKKLERYFERACSNEEDGIENVVLIMEVAFSQQLSLEIDWPHHSSEELILERVYEEIRVRYKDPMTLEELAENAGLDRYTLVRRFHKRYNTTPHSWQIMLRVNEAKSLLENGKSVTEAALEVGFYDQSHFTKTFKETYGVTPKKYAQHRP